MQNNDKNEVLTVENRKKITISCVQSVDGFSDRVLKTTVNGKTLETDIILTPADINADAQGSAENALNQAKTYVDTKISTETSQRTNAITAHNVANDAHADIRTLISTLQNKVTTLLDSDDTTLDQMSEVVAYIKNNKSLIDSITTDKVNVSDIVNNLTTNSTNKPLSAAQGVAIKALIDALTTEVNKKAEIKDINVMTGATAEVAGAAGFVPAPAAGKNTSFLRGDGTWVVPTDTKYNAATTATDGLMSATDKSKLDAIANSADAVSFAQSLTSGTQVGTITINGTETKLFAPSKPSISVNNSQLVITT